MRIAVLTWTRRRVAGAETYLTTVIPALLEAGHEVALLAELDRPADGAQIAPPGLPEWCLEASGGGEGISGLKRWQPHVLYAHGLLDPGLEASLLEVAPAALFTHGYYGTCISGAKRFRVPTARPCDRRFGLSCWLQYYPRRCGGLSPFNMVRDYRLQSRRHRLLRRYRAILAPSRRLKAEYLRHGIPAERVHRVPLCVQSIAQPETGAAEQDARHPEICPHIVFLGRMTAEKGGQVLLAALPLIRSALRRPLRVTFAGDGPQRATWHERAAHLSIGDQALNITFPGWLNANQRDSLLGQADLLVIPSVWPDPSPLVGFEAASRGVPVAAFAVGGLPDWVQNGVNGFLAPADPPTPEGLAEAVVNCLADPRMMVILRAGAAETVKERSVSAHLARLEPILASIT